MLKVIDHPLIKDKLTRMRKIETISTSFRFSLIELTKLMTYEATKNLPIIQIEINTPIVKNVIGYKLKEKVILVPILRAGLGMVDGVKDVIPNAAIGHIGLYRDKETKNVIEYFTKMPEHTENSHIILLDPMLATGVSVCDAVSIIKKYKPASITFICIVASQDGIDKLVATYPDVNIYTASIDDKLDDNGFIVPGLGDAGDRIFGTK